jgi:hypothetical protein
MIDTTRRATNYFDSIHFVLDVFFKLYQANIHRPSSVSSMQLIQQSIRIYLRSYIQPYDQLKQCEQDILEIINNEFTCQSGHDDDQQPFVKTLWLSHRTKTYSSWINRADKFLKDLIDLHESFRKVSHNKCVETKTIFFDTCSSSE